MLVEWREKKKVTVCSEVIVEDLEERERVPPEKKRGQHVNELVELLSVLDVMNVRTVDYNRPLFTSTFKV